MQRTSTLRCPPSGKAEMLASFVIVRDISSDWSLLFTDCRTAPADGATLQLAVRLQPPVSPAMC
eukprot:scaffold33436_cov54-Phaeocystis_antarctica.AAC.3